MPTKIKRTFEPKVSTKLTRLLARLCNAHHAGSLRLMAKNLGCDHATLWRLANGVTKRPDPQLLVDIAALHKLDLNQLFR